MELPSRKLRPADYAKLIGVVLSVIGGVAASVLWATKALGLQARYSGIWYVASVAGVVIVFSLAVLAALAFLYLIWSFSERIKCLEKELTAGQNSYDRLESKLTIAPAGSVSIQVIACRCLDECLSELEFVTSGVLNEHGPKYKTAMQHHANMVKKVQNRCMTKYRSDRKRLICFDKLDKTGIIKRFDDLKEDVLVQYKDAVSKLSSPVTNNDEAEQCISRVAGNLGECLDRLSREVGGLKKIPA